jgi:hypothetical protein
MPQTRREDPPYPTLSTRLMSDPAHPCGFCSASVKKGTWSIFCVDCEHWFHEKCLDMTTEDIRSCSKHRWHCGCKGPQGVLECNGAGAVIIDPPLSQPDNQNALNPAQPPPTEELTTPTQCMADLHISSAQSSSTDPVATSRGESTGLTQEMEDMNLSDDTQQQRPVAERQAATTVGVACPVTNCRSVCAPTTLIQHLERHCQGLLNGTVPDQWLTQQGRFVCRCSRLVSDSRRAWHCARCPLISSDHLHQGPPADSEQTLPTLEDVMSVRRSTLKHIPKNARQSFGKVLSDCLNAVIS